MSAVRIVIDCDPAVACLDFWDGGVGKGGGGSHGRAERCSVVGIILFSFEWLDGDRAGEAEVDHGKSRLHWNRHGSASSCFIWFFTHPALLILVVVGYIIGLASFTQTYSDTFIVCADGFGTRVTWFQAPNHARRHPAESEDGRKREIGMHSFRK